MSSNEVSCVCAWRGDEERAHLEIEIEIDIPLPRRTTTCPTARPFLST